MTQEKKQPAKRIQLVDVVLERKGSQLFSSRRVRYNRAPGAQTILIIVHRVHKQF